MTASTMTAVRVTEFASTQGRTELQSLIKQLRAVELAKRGEAQTAKAAAKAAKVATRSSVVAGQIEKAQAKLDARAAKLATDQAKLQAKRLKFGLVPVPVVTVMTEAEALAAADVNPLHIAG